jgi:hypothetical protein
MDGVERGRGDYYEKVEGYCLTDGRGTCMSPASNGSSRLWRMGEEILV